MRFLGHSLSKYLLLPLTSVLLFCALLIYWLTATESGSGWLVRKAANLTPYQLDAVSVKGTLASGLDIRKLELTLPTQQITIGGVSGKWQLLSLLGGQFHLQQLNLSDVDIAQNSQPVSADSPAHWPTLRSPIPLTIDNLTISNVRYTAKDQQAATIGDFNFAGIVSPLNIHVRKLDFTNSAGKIEISGKLANSFPYKHKISVHWQLTVDERNFDGNASLEGALDKTRIQHQLNSPTAIDSRGTLSLANTQEAIRVDSQSVILEMYHEWQPLPFTLGDRKITTAGNLKHAGSLNAFTIKLETLLKKDSANTEQSLLQLASNSNITTSADATLPISVTLEGKGSGQQLEITSSDISTARGSGEISGKIDWHSTPRWDLSLVAQTLDLSPFLKGWPLTLSGEIDSAGEIKDGQILAQVSTQSLNGSLDQHPFTAEISAIFEAGKVTLDAASLSLGENQFQGYGTLGATSDFEWQVNAANLDIFGVGATGSLTSTGTFSGTIDNPVMSALINSPGLSYDDWQIGELNLTASMEANGKMDVQGEVHHVESKKFAPLTRGSVRVAASGTLLEHRLNLTIDAPDLEFHFNALGRYNDRVWRGELDGISLSTLYSGLWQQSGTSEVAISTGNISLQELCLRRQGSLCIRADYSDKRFSAEGELSALDLGLIESWIPPDATLTGTVDINFKYSNRDNAHQGEFLISSTAAVLGYSGDGGEIRHPLQLSGNGHVQQHQLTMTAALAIENSGLLSSELNASLQGDISLSGIISAEMNNLEWLEALTSTIDSPSGTINGSFDLTGSMRSPIIKGSLQLDDFRGTVPATGMQLADGRVNMEFMESGEWQLQSHIETQNGTANISGDGTTRDLLHGELTLSVTGQEVTLIDLPDTRIDISPAITVARVSRSWKINGDLDIPNAEITLRPLPEGAVAVSNDEIITPPLDDNKKGSEITLKLGVTLEDQVHIEGYGLNTNLSGKLKLNQDNSGPINARGRIQLIDGTYEGYGQELTITRGYLIFQGDLENPGLNIVTVRDTPTAKVGLRISGVLKQIESDVFSDPVLPPTEALTVLVTGKPPGGISQSEANLVANAAVALGISQSEWITSRLQSSFGVDVLALEGGDTYEDSSLVVGKQLTPKIYISYAQNLFSPQSSFILQYQLTGRLGLKAESGETHSLDLRYKIEH